MANKIADNNRISKRSLLLKRCYKYRMSGHDWAWIAKKLGMKEVSLRALLS